MEGFYRKVPYASSIMCVSCSHPMLSSRVHAFYRSVSQKRRWAPSELDLRAAEASKVSEVR
jgi:hypothetical protein